MSQLEISLLGSFRATCNGADITEVLRTRKERAILAFLAEESRRPQPREKVAEIFWPERQESYARMNLRQALLGIRKAFGSEESANLCLSITESTVQLGRANLFLDTHQFAEELQTIKGHAHSSLVECSTCVQGLESALRFYRGDFLDDLVLGDVLDFQEWLVMRRERYQGLAINAVQTLGEIYYQRGEYQAAYHHAWRYLELAPLEEAAHRLLMRLLALSGRRNAALQQYDACRIIVQRELGIAPSTETRRLYEQIKNEQAITYPDTRPILGDATLDPVRILSPETPLYDPVTQIPTRPLFYDRVRHALVRMARDQQMAAIGMLAILLPTSELAPELRRQAQQIAVRRIMGCLRQADTVALLNENEFGLLIENINGQAGLQVVADKLVRSLEGPVTLLGKQMHLGVALGVSLYPQSGIVADELINTADAAMHRARLHKVPYLLQSSS